VHTISGHDNWLKPNQSSNKESAIALGGISITEGPKAQADSTNTIPFRIEVQTAGGTGVLELTQSAATELVKEIGVYLQAHGFQ